MTRPSTPPILSELRSASSPASQVAALRALKNELIGHEQKKEMWIGLGVLAPIARILNTHKGNGKKRHRDVYGSRGQPKQRGGRSDEEEARYQAIIIVGSLAHGGSPYISPIYAGLLIPPLLSILSPTESSPQLVLAALRTLNAVADSLSLSRSDHDTSDEGLLALLYTEQHLSTVTNILLQTPHSLIVQQQIALTAVLISKTCQEEHHRVLLAQSGVMEALAVRLASFIVSTGCALKPSIYAGLGPGIAGEDGHSPSTSRLSPILQAISAIIQHSKSRANQFLSTSAFASVFQRSDAEAASYQRQVTGWGPNASSTFATRQSPSNIIDHLLPSVPNSHFRSSLAPASNFPPLGALGSAGKQSQTSRSFSSTIEVIQSQGLEFIEEEESPLLGWLLYIARTEDEVTGLTAAWLLAILYRQGLTKRGRDATLALLLVPILSRMLDKDLKTSPGVSHAYDLSSRITPEKFIKQQAPSVIAMLAANSLEVQKAAAEAGIIKKLSQLLKESYDEMSLELSASMWAPESSASGQKEKRDNASKLGPSGLSPIACHIMRLRESVFVALAAIASDKDEYRKAIIENGIVPLIIKTLKPEDTDPSSVAHNSEAASQVSPFPVGNPKATILAACGAARALSRSVSTLRTSLMDAGLTPPLFVLLKHQDMDLQIHATAVVCNLVLQFSPMQEAIIEAGALKILCEHAHSINTNLRLNSVWALKHLVLQASNDIKMKCLEELGPGWLKQIVNNDVEVPNLFPSPRGDREEGSATPIRMSTPNAAGERVDLLNAVENDSRESSQDVDDDGEEDLRMEDSIGVLSGTEFEGKQHAMSSYQNDSRKPLLDSRNTDRSPFHPGMANDLAIQKQGLELLRNLLCGDGASEMIDFIFREFGKDKLFEMLAAKLRPRVVNVFNRERRSSENGVRHIQPQIEIVISICYIIVHIAAGHPRQRQLLIAQTELLKLMVPLFNHTECEIRSCCVWTCLNLIWVDDDSDKSNCKARARELVKLGVYEKLEQMENDPVLDVRERAKTATHQMATLLR